MTYEPPTCPDAVRPNVMDPDAAPIRIYCCKRCGTLSSVFWWPCSFGQREFYFCDDCMLKFAEFIKEGQA